MDPTETDVTQVTRPDPAVRRLPRAGSAPLAATVLGIVAVATVVVALVPSRDTLGPTMAAVVLMLVVVVSTAAGGARAGLAVAVAATIGLNIGFVRPYGTLNVAALEGAVELLVFLGVAGAVSLLVHEQTRRRREAEAREQELRVANQRLEALQAERVLLAEQADRAEDLEFKELQRSALLRAVSHDLRTPLSSIRAVATDLRDGVVYDERTTRELLEIVCDETDRLDRLVTNLLSLSRIESGAFMPAPRAVDLAELVADRFAKLAPLLREVAPRTDLPEGLPLVHADYQQLEQVITNLLANAARYAPSGTDLWVLARTDDTIATPMVRVEVSDQGVGIPDEEAESMFEPFRSGPESRSTGVGLAICRAIVEAHGGRIWVERTFGGGATIAFTLPAHRDRVDHEES